MQSISEKTQVDSVTDSLAAGDWPTDGSWPYEYPRPRGKRFKEYSGRHRAGDERIGVYA